MKLPYNNAIISKNSFETEMIVLEKIDSNDLNPTYQELANIVGIQMTIQIYSLYKGQQISFPSRLFSKEYITSQILKEYNGTNARELAIKYEYSERWIREIIKRNKQHHKTASNLTLSHNK